MRFWEIDFARGIAIILMIIFNYAFTLRFFDLLNFDSWFFWFLFPRIIASMFIIIAGISLAISYSKGREKKEMKVKRQKNPDSIFSKVGEKLNKTFGTFSSSYLYRKYLLRGLKIFSLGMLITLSTYLFVPRGTIFFGILHFLGMATILALPFLKVRTKHLAIAAFLVILLGIYLTTLQFTFSLLFWLVPSTFYTLDYFPLLPWFGIMLIGLYSGNTLYKNNKRSFKILIEPKISKPVNFLGRHSLIIYIIHQPILVVVLYLLGYRLF